MIPVFEPLLGAKTWEYVKDALDRNAISGTMGKDYIGRFEEACARSCGAKHGITTTSGTTSLALAVACLDLQAGDEVIVSSFTNIATALAVVYAGATPVFADSESETWNLDPAVLPGLITARTKAVIPVHIYGHPVDLDPILEISRKHGLTVIEDAAEAQGARYKGRPVGALGDLGCLSFFVNKVVTTGEGGMLVTNDDALAARARLRKNLAYSSRDKFVHEEIGYNYRMPNLSAAVGLAQVEQLEEIIRQKRRIAGLYRSRLEGIPGLRLQVEKPWAESVYWMVGILLGEGHPPVTKVQDGLTAAGIETRRFFNPLHRQPVFENLGLAPKKPLPVSERLWDRGLYLPSSPRLTEAQIQSICDTLRRLL